MKLRLLVIPALMATTLLAQGPPPGGRRGYASGTRGTPPTAAQLAANQLRMAATYLGLDSAQSTALTGNTALVGELTGIQGTLQGNAATLKTDRAAAATAIV